MPKEDVAKLKFRRVHSMPAERSEKTPTTEQRLIIAKLIFYKDVRTDIDPGLEIGFADDYPKETNESRKALLPVLLKGQDGEKASAPFNVGRLAIKGQIYHGPEIENLSLYAKVLTS